MSDIEINKPDGGVRGSQTFAGGASRPESPDELAKQIAEFLSQNSVAQMPIAAVTTVTGGENRSKSGEPRVR